MFRGSGRSAARPGVLVLELGVLDDGLKELPVLAQEPPPFRFELSQRVRLSGLPVTLRLSGVYVRDDLRAPGDAGFVEIARSKFNTMVSLRKYLK